MENRMQIFNDERFGKIRTMTTEEGQILFVGKDVARALGYSNPSKAIMFHVCDNNKTMMVVEADSQNGNVVRTRTTFINEGGLYELVFSSKLESAQEFKLWVTNEVLPQIRQTGGYIPLHGNANENENENRAGAGADDEATIMAKALLIAQNTIKMKDALLGAVRRQREAERPLVEFAQMVQGSDDTCTIAELAKMITSNGYEIGQNRLFEWLRHNHYLGSSKHHRNVAYQCYLESGLFELRYSEPWYDDHGNPHYKVTTLVTPKGQEYFLNKFKKC